MKWAHIALLTAPAAVLAVPRFQRAPDFIVQSPGSGGGLANELGSSSGSSVVLPDLTVSDFETVQHTLREGVERASESLYDFAESLLDALQGGRGDDDAAGVAAATAADGAAPHRPPPYIDFTQYTILEILNASLHNHHDHHHDHDHEHDEESSRPHWRFPFPRPPKPPTHPSELPLHRLGWLVNKSSEAQELLSKEGITLLAPDDEALTPPHRRRGPPGRPHHGPHDHDDVQDAARDDAAQIEASVDEEMQHQPVPHPFYSREFRQPCPKRVAQLSGDDDDEDRKAKISKIIGFILSYHTIESVQTERDLVDRSTIGTALEKERIRIQPAFTLRPLPHPTLRFNFYSYKRGPYIKAKNGIIHLVSAPLLPPLSPLSTAFLFPTFFSTLTSDLQKVDLAESLLPKIPHGDDDDVADPTHVMAELVEALKEKDKPFTVFAPTNWAFNKLGLKNLALLHSPFPLAKKSLKYILSYHVVPDIAFYSDFIDNATSLAPYVLGQDFGVDVDPAWIDEAFESQDLHLPSWVPKLPGGGPPPPPPGHDHPHPPPHGDHPPPHKNVNVTHYRLPTLLSQSGVNENATLRVDVVSYHQWGHGPIRRAVVVLPAHDHHHHDHDGDDHHHGDDKQEASAFSHPPPPHHRGPPPARPIKAVKADVPARNGAIHVLHDILRPPFPQHHHDDEDKHAKHARAFSAFFA